MSEAKDDKLNLVLQHAADVRKFEIDLFWRRSLFFWGFLSAAFIAYGTLSSQKADPDVIFAIACFGIICSLAWTLVNRGSKYWHEAWEQKLLSVQAEALGQDLFSRFEAVKSGGLWGAARYSVSRLTIALSEFVVLVWLLLAVKASPLAGVEISPWSYLTLGVTLIYAAGMLVYGRSRNTG
jgi:hypothetical protein